MKDNLPKRPLTTKRFYHLDIYNPTIKFDLAPGNSSCAILARVAFLPISESKLNGSAFLLVLLLHLRLLLLAYVFSPS